MLRAKKDGGMEIYQGWLVRHACLTVAILGLCTPLCAQESSSSTSTPPPDQTQQQQQQEQQQQQQEQQQQQSSGQPTDETKGTDTIANPPPPSMIPNPTSPIDTEIHSAGRAVPWMGSTSPLRWGDFSVAAFTLNYVNDNFRPEGSTDTSTLNLAVFRTTIGFDRFFGRQHLVIQINPQVAILNGQLGANAGLNNNFTLAFVFQLTPKLTMTLKNGFDLVHSRQLFPMDVLNVDALAGNALANDFLQNAGSFWRDSVSAAFNYSITPRLLLTVAPSYSYAQTTDTQENYIANGSTIANSVALTYALTPRQNIGVLQTTQLLRAVGVPNASNTYFNTLGVFYGYQIAKTWWVQGRIGFDAASYPNNYPSELTVGGGGSLIKGFTNSNLAVTYSRGQMEENFISAAISNRVDVTYGLQLTKRFGWYNGAGYYHDSGIQPQNKGEYVTSKLQYMLSKGFSLFANYTYIDQQAGTEQLLSGITHTFSAGIGWLPTMNAPGH
jgi:hypothetical protein